MLNSTNHINLSLVNSLIDNDLDETAIRYLCEGVVHAKDMTDLNLNCDAESSYSNNNN